MDIITFCVENKEVQINVYMAALLLCASIGRRT